MSREAPRIEIVDEEAAAVLRLKTPAERLEIAFRMWSATRVMLSAVLRQENPGWSDQQLEAEIARRLSGGSS